MSGARRLKKKRPLREYETFADFLRAKRRKARDVQFDSDEDEHEGPIPSEAPQNTNNVATLACNTELDTGAETFFCNSEPEEAQVSEISDNEQIKDPESDSNEDDCDNVATVAAVKDPAVTIKDFGNYVVKLQARGKMSKAAATKLVAFMRKNNESIGQGLINNELPSFKTLHAKELRRVPERYLDISCDGPDGKEVKLEGLKKLPRKKLKRERLQLRYELSYVSLLDVYKLHQDLHSEKAVAKTFDFSIDGVPETISGGVSIDVLSVHFVGCRNVYIVAILRPKRKGMALSDSIILERFLQDISRSDLAPRYCIADAPKRAKLQGFISHSGKQSCQYCFASKLHGKFPASTRNAEPRTMDAVRKIVNYVETEADGDFANVSESRLRGIKDKSPLWSLPNFDITRHVPAECMHLLDLGILRKMLGLTYKVPGKKVIEKVRRVPVTQVNMLLRNVKVVADFSRRSRGIDIGTWKAQEYRNLALFLFPAVLKTCSDPCKKIWLHTIYIYRALMLPPDLFDYNRHKEEVARMVHNWYAIFEGTFGKENCVFNVHTFHHVMEVRDLGPLTETSAYRYEDEYQHLKNAYAAGTASTGLQALKNLYVATLSGHSCEKSIELRGRCTSQVNDRILYLRDGRILEVTTIEDDLVEGTIIPLEGGLHLIPGCDFNLVLCFKRSKYASTSPKNVATSLREVAGKVIDCCDILSVVPLNVLRA